MLFQFSLDRLINAIDIRQHVVIPEAQDPEPLFAQPLVSLRVRLAAMLPTIDFQRQPGFQAGEIDYELAEGLLTTEFEAQDLSFAQDVP